MAIGNILRIFRIFYDHLGNSFCVHLVHFFLFWYHVPRKIWQPWRAHVWSHFLTTHLSGPSRIAFAGRTAEGADAGAVLSAPVVHHAESAGLLHGDAPGLRVPGVDFITSVSDAI
jgi:hypothetical protein